MEAGVPFITINDGGWDTHKDNFEAMRRKLPILDQAISRAARGPGAARPAAIDRGHLVRRVRPHPARRQRGRPGSADATTGATAFSAVVAGGGFKGGQVLGSTDARGENVRDRPVYPWDLSASIYKLLGIDPHGRLPHPQGCVAYVSPLAGGTVQSGGLLTEIM